MHKGLLGNSKMLPIEENKRISKKYFRFKKLVIKYNNKSIISSRFTISNE